jgi:hypothetical protein
MQLQQLSSEATRRYRSTDVLVTGANTGYSTGNRYCCGFSLHFGSHDDVIPFLRQGHFRRPQFFFLHVCCGNK